MLLYIKKPYYENVQCDFRAFKVIVSYSLIPPHLIIFDLPE